MEKESVMLRTLKRFWIRMADRFEMWPLFVSALLGALIMGAVTWIAFWSGNPILVFQEIMYGFKGLLYSPWGILLLIVGGMFMIGFANQRPLFQKAMFYTMCLIFGLIGFFSVWSFSYVVAIALAPMP